MSVNHEKGISRRDLLKGLGMSAAAGLGAHMLRPGNRPAEASQGGSQEGCGILVDLSRCVGCNSCALACKYANQLPDAEMPPTGLSSDTYTFVEDVTVTMPDGSVQVRHVKRQCMHCLNAACVSACPAAAMYSSGEGPVVYRANRCLGCRYCEVGCPFGIPRFNWDEGLTAKINKCWLCYDRLKQGEQPACVSACPTGALRFGTRSRLLADAHALIATQSERYVDHVFGEHEVGGTSMLYVSDVPFEDLGFPADLPLTAPPEETEKIMTALPYVIVGMASLMTGVAAYTHREAARKSKE